MKTIKNDCKLSIPAIKRATDQKVKKAAEALKNIQNLLSGEPSEENARDAYLFATDALKLLVDE